MAMFNSYVSHYQSFPSQNCGSFHPFFYVHQRVESHLDHRQISWWRSTGMNLRHCQVRRRKEAGMPQLGKASRSEVSMAGMANG